MEIKCKKVSCKYNKNTVCMAETISVNAFQGCNSFVSDENKKIVIRKINSFETSQDMTAYIHSPNKDVLCSCLDCKFNYDKLCSSNGITLATGDSTAVCVSYIEK